MAEGAYMIGFIARLAGEPETANPHRVLTDDWSAWAEGWKDQDHHLNERDAVLDSIGWFG